MAELGSHSLYESTDLQLWSASYQCYSEVVRDLSAQKSKKSTQKRKTESLVELDNWYQYKLPKLLPSRDEPHLKHEELCRLMTWKLTRGKFRPRLTELVKQNNPETVEAITSKGISLLPKLEAAIQHVSQLKGVGPATASAILCAAAPVTVPFMADESVLSVPGLGKLDYNLKHYLLYAEKIRDKADELNKIGDHEATGDVKTEWTVHDVELALWAFHYAKKLKPELLQIRQTQETVTNPKRPRSEDGSDCSSSDEDKPTKSKRLKHS